MNRYLRSFFVVILLIFLFFTITQSVFAQDTDVILEFFYAEECSHCEEKEPIIDKIDEQYEDKITVYRFSIKNNANRELFYSYGFRSTPGTVIFNQSSNKAMFWFVYDNTSEENLQNAIEYHLIGNYTEEPPQTKKDSFCMETPFGTFCFNLSELSLPVITIVLGALDSINPCSFFILLFFLRFFSLSLGLLTPIKLMERGEKESEGLDLQRDMQT